MTLSTIDKYKMNRRLSKQLVAISTKDLCHIDEVAEASIADQRPSGMLNNYSNSNMTANSNSMLNRNSQLGGMGGRMSTNRRLSTSLGSDLGAQRKRRLSIVSVECIPGADNTITGQSSTCEESNDEDEKSTKNNNFDPESISHNSTGTNNDQETPRLSQRRRSSIANETLEKFNAEQSRREKLASKAPGLTYTEPQDATMIEVSNILSQSMQVGLFSSDEDSEDDDSNDTSGPGSRGSQMKKNISAGKVKNRSDSIDDAALMHHQNRESTSSVILKHLTEKQNKMKMKRNMDKVLRGNYFT